MEVTLVAQDYACPECGAMLAQLAGPEGTSEWNCPMCGVEFGTEEELLKLLAKKAQK